MGEILRSNNHQKANLTKTVNSSMSLKSKSIIPKNSPYNPVRIYCTEEIFLLNDDPFKKNEYLTKFL